MFGVYFWVCLYPAVPVMYLDGKELALCLGVFLLTLLGFLPTPLRAQLFPGASPTLPDLLPPSCLLGRRGGVGLWGPGRLERVEGQPAAPLLTEERQRHLPLPLP